MNCCNNIDVAAGHEIERLADYLLRQWGFEIGVDNDDSAVDVVIRLLDCFVAQLNLDDDDYGLL